MKRRILAYLDYIDDILQNDDSNDKEHWDKVIKKHLDQIGFFSYE